ncbi:MAG TPA: PKD domain-containing protein, partial [Methanosarcina sp.]|nr:PKD domain-containing protein [Methanosarcina sp.]
GDGSRSFVQNPVHKYAKAGKYTISLTVKNAKGSNIKTMSDYVVVS